MPRNVDDRMIGSGEKMNDADRISEYCRMQLHAKVLTDICELI